MFEWLTGRPGARRRRSPAPMGRRSSSRSEGGRRSRGGGSPRATRTSRIFAGVGLVVLVVVLTGATALWVVLHGMTNPVRFVSLAEAVPGTRINILVMGLDAPINSRGRAVPNFDIHGTVHSRTDTMMVVSVDTQSYEVGVLALPRDTRVMVSGRENMGYDKLGHAHAYTGNPDSLIATVSDFLDIPIHYYVRINSQGVADIIDLLGGVEVYVPYPMRYTDPYQDLVINIDQGLQVLDGEKAVGFLRYRGGRSDLERIDRQQQFLQALKDKLFSLGGISRVPAIIGEIGGSVDTNMTASQMLSFAKTAAQISMPDVEMATIPGDIRTIEDPGQPPLSYYVSRTDDLMIMVDHLLWGVDPEINAAITLEVLNGTGVSGLAGRFATELERQGYTVVNVGDAERSDFALTEIIDRTPDSDKLRRLSQAVLRYLPQAELGRARAIEDKPEFTIILGQDYADLLSALAASDN